ncbi:hypothetical protein HC179_15485 [Bacillus sp. RO1]|nr:hypothetical protein [Bacillus sp. RO1]
MENKLKQLRKAMDSTTHKGIHFTEFKKNNIRKAILTDGKGKPNSPNKLAVFLISTFAICLLAFFVSTEFLIRQNNEKINGGPGAPDMWEIRHEYKENQNILFSIFPDPELEAGKPYGYIFNFAEPFKTYKGKELSISALNKETGERVQVLSPQKIIEPSSGYSSLQRFTVTFQVPYGGIWKYQVYLDGKAYGDVAVSVDEKAKDGSIILPEEIPNFVEVSNFEKVDWDKKAVTFNDNIIGNENKSGVIGADMPSININQKWMWHLWGVENPRETELTVVGFHRYTGTVHQIITTGWTIGLGGGNNGANAHAPSSVNIPKSGEWAILLYTDGKLFDILVYEINE